MLGFDITVYRQPSVHTTLATSLAVAFRESPTTWPSDHGERLTGWRSGIDGLGWLDELVAEGRATQFTGNGYPTCYSAVASATVARISALHVAGDPCVSAVDVMSLETTCDPGEWLMIEAWDLS